MAASRAKRSDWQTETGFPKHWGLHSDWLREMHLDLLTAKRSGSPMGSGLERR